MSYLQNRPYPAFTILVGGAAHSAHEYLTERFQPTDTGFGDEHDRIAGYWEVGADKFQAFDNRNNQLWEEEFPSVEHCQAWLNPLLSLEAFELQEMSVEVVQQLTWGQFTVVLIEQSPAQEAHTFQVLAEDSLHARKQAREAYTNFCMLDGRPRSYRSLKTKICAVFEGFHPDISRQFI